MWLSGKVSIIVKGLNAPERCETCAMAACYRNSGSIWCNAMNRRLVSDWDGDTEVEIDVPEWCPIRELPKKHGRLIDADALMEKSSWYNLCGHNMSIHGVQDYEIASMETIVESEGE